MSDITDAGRASRRRVLGDAHVERAEAKETAFDAPFQALITDAAWGHVWSRGTISDRERSMLTIAFLAGLGNDHELALHARDRQHGRGAALSLRYSVAHPCPHAGQRPDRRCRCGHR